MVAVDDFLPRARALDRPRVLELGVRRSESTRSTLHDDLLPNAGEYLGTDIQDGADVDIVADLHVLSDIVGRESFDIVLSFSTFEHVKYPHIAAHEIMKILTVGGLLFIQTHQTYALHAYPNDYFRFSTAALASLFGDEMGFRVHATEYLYPAEIHSQELGLARTPFPRARPFLARIARAAFPNARRFEKARRFGERSTQGAFLNTHLFGEKIAATPDHYVYDFESKAGTRIATLESPPTPGPDPSKFSHVPVWNRKGFRRCEG